MASINTIVKRKQYLWLGIVVVGTASAIGGALYLSDVDMSGNGETVAEQEPVPDMTGVVDTTFDDKVRQHATTEMQVTAAQMQKQYEEIRRELDVLNKQRGDDQRRIEKLGQDNAALAEQVKALGANPVTATGEPVPQMPASPPGPEGEPQPGNTPVSFPPQGSVAVPPPTAFYPGNGVTPPPQVTYQSVPVPNRIQRKVFIRDVLLEDVAQRNIPLSHKKLRRALKAITRSESYLCAMKAGACRYDTEGYVTEHISQEEEAYAAERLDKIRRQNRIKAELQAVLDEK
ncbi:fertility inhibition protein FinO [Escherichia coli]|nr:fertility inhibition protein FinO [Escherichia coli]